MTVRRATPDDVAELVRLRVLMYESWGTDTTTGNWRKYAEEHFRESLVRSDFAAFVVDGPDGGLLASGIGWVERHLPGPRNETGRRGHIASMSTNADARRQGHGRAIFAALLGWFDELGVTRIDLRATPMGEPLYRSFGFAEGGGAPLTYDTTGRVPDHEWTTPAEGH